MHKELIVLGLLLRQPLHGHELHRIVRAHGELYADLKKANLYHLLNRLAKQGCLKVKSETGARGRTGERRIYALTSKGRTRFTGLLREVVRHYETVHAGVEVAVIFLSRLPRKESIAMLEERRSVVRTYKVVLAKQLGEIGKRGLFGRISAEHMFAMTDAELAWIDQSLATLRQAPANDPDFQPIEH